MRLLEETDLVQGGIAGDAHFAPESARQLLLADQEPLLELGVAAGQIKENITVRGLGVMSLPAGTRLAIGEAEIEITKECEPCSRMAGDGRAGPPAGKGPARRPGARRG